MTSFEALPIFSKELTVVPDVYSSDSASVTVNNPTSTNTTAKNARSHQQLVSRKPLSLSQLTLAPTASESSLLSTTRSSSSTKDQQYLQKPAPPLLWSKNPLSNEALLPFAVPTKEEELEREKRQRIREMKLRNQMAAAASSNGGEITLSSSSYRQDGNYDDDDDENDEAPGIDWKEEKLATNNHELISSRHSTSSGNILDGTRRRSPLHSVHDDLKRVNDQTQVNYGRRKQITNLKRTTSMDGENFHHGKPRAVIHDHAEAEKEWGFQVAELVQNQKPKNQSQLHNQPCETNHAVHAATARPMPVSLIREAVAHLNRADDEEEFGNNGRKRQSPRLSARTAGCSPIQRSSTRNKQIKNDLIFSNRDIVVAENDLPPSEALVVTGDPLEGKNPDALPITKRHHHTVGEITEHGSFIKGSTQRVLNRNQESLKKLQVQTMDPTAVFSDLHAESRMYSPRNENVAARNRKIFLVQPNMRVEPPLLSTRVSAPPKKVVEPSLCVSKETCGTKQSFLYKLGDVGRN